MLPHNVIVLRCDISHVLLLNTVGIIREDINSHNKYSTVPSVHGSEGRFKKTLSANYCLSDLNLLQHIPIAPRDCIII